jgi:hypothetical protein
MRVGEVKGVDRGWKGNIRVSSRIMSKKGLNVSFNGGRVSI